MHAMFMYNDIIITELIIGNIILGYVRVQQGIFDGLHFSVRKHRI